MPHLDALVATLTDRLRHPLPGHAAHAEMAPFPARATEETLSIERNEGRPAATLILLYPDTDAEAHFVLTVRHAGLRDHAGQVSLPANFNAGAFQREVAIVANEQRGLYGLGNLFNTGSGRFRSGNSRASSSRSRPRSQRRRRRGVASASST